MFVTCLRSSRISFSSRPRLRSENSTIRHSAQLTATNENSKLQAIVKLLCAEKYVLQVLNIFVAVFQTEIKCFHRLGLGEPQLDLSKNTTRQLFVSNIWSKIKYFLYRIYLTFSFCYTGLETALHVWRIPPRFFLTPCTVADSNRAMNPGWLQAVLLKMTSSHHAKHSLSYSCVTCMDCAM